MYEPQSSFLALALAGAIPLGEIDQYVDRWHDSVGYPALHDYLGMTRDEYGLWLAVPDALPLILMSRELDRPLDIIVQQHLQSAPAAADAPAKRLESWLKRHADATQY
jgi:hypothetical protein